VIAANQAGDTDYSAAPQVTQSIVVDLPAVLTSPAPSSTLVGPAVTFTWTAATGSGNQGYWLFLGTTGVGSKDLYDSNQQTATSATFKNLPNNGETIYARVYTKFNGTLVYNDYTYSTVAQAVLTSPAPGSTLVGPSVTFTWSAATGPGNQGYWLFLGTTGVGSKDLYDSNQTTATSATFKSLPNKGETIYARVYTKFNGTLVYNDYTYSTVTQAVLTSPAPGSTLVGPSVTFAWTAATGPGNEGYWLFLGTTGVGSKDLYDSNQQTATSATFKSLPNKGETVYARVYTKFNGTLVYNDYTYSTVSQAVMTSPTPGSTLAGTSQTFTWSAATGPGNEGYWLFLGTTGVGSKDLYDSGQQTATSATFNALPTNGETIYARVYTKFNGTLVYNDYTYKAK
jgi:archaellum component FlaF (FlaF/FlaG flagellin family)